MRHLGKNEDLNRNAPASFPIIFKYPGSLQNTLLKEADQRRETDVLLKTSLELCFVPFRTYCTPLDPVAYLEFLKQHCKERGASLESFRPLPVLKLDGVTLYQFSRINCFVAFFRFHEAYSNSENDREWKVRREYDDKLKTLARLIGTDLKYCKILSESIRRKRMRGFDFVFFVGADGGSFFMVDEKQLLVHAICLEVLKEKIAKEVTESLLGAEVKLAEEKERGGKGSRKKKEVPHAKEGGGPGKKVEEEEQAAGKKKSRRRRKKRTRNRASINVPDAPVGGGAAGEALEVFDGGAVEEVFDGRAVEEVFDGGAVEEVSDGGAVEKVSDGEAVEEVFDREAVVEEVSGGEAVEEVFDGEEGLDDGACRVCFSTWGELIPPRCSVEHWPAVHRKCLDAFTEKCRSRGVADVPCVVCGRNW